MIQIKYTIRPFVKPNGQVAVRVRWNNNTSEVSFITGVYAEREKWDEDCCEKYVQAFLHITKSDPKVTPYNITIETMLALKSWYIENGYRYERFYSSNVFAGLNDLFSP